MHFSVIFSDSEGAGTKPVTEIKHGKVMKLVSFLALFASFTGQAAVDRGSAKTRSRNGPKRAQLPVNIPHSFAQKIE